MAFEDSIMHANLAAARPAVLLGYERSAFVERLNRVARREPAAVLGVLSFWLRGGMENRRTERAPARPLRSPSL